MATYEWAAKFNEAAKGVTLNDQPDASDFVEVIEKAGGDPEKMVDICRPKRSKCHKTFEWDDSVAGERYRIEQAKLATRCVRVRYENTEGKEATVRAFSSVVDPTGKTKKRVYVDTYESMSHDQLRHEMLMQCLAGLNAWRKRWSEYNELSEVFESIEQAQRKLEKVVAG